jgi:hypothetical protein
VQHCLVGSEMCIRDRPVPMERELRALLPRDVSLAIDPDPLEL